jgi:hypothetical protein
VKFGAIYNDREVDSLQYVQDVAPPTDLAGISSVYHYEDVGGYGSATELDFLVLDFDRAKEAYVSGLRALAWSGQANMGCHRTDSGCLRRLQLLCHVGGP